MSEPISESAPRLDRRSLLKVLALGTAGAGAGSVTSTAQEKPASVPAGAEAAKTNGPAPVRTDADADLVMPVRCPWPLLLTAPELETAAALADVILPADEKSPAASAVGVPLFLNEWVSAPYPLQQDDLAVVRGGLSWLNTECAKRFGADFAKLTAPQQTAICDDLCYLPKAKPEHLTGARFFAKFRDLCASGYYTTNAAFEELGYIGNRPTPTYDGAPREVLEKLGV